MRKLSVILVAIFLMAFAPALVWGFFGTRFSGLWPGARFDRAGNWGYGLGAGSFYIGGEESSPNGFVLSASGKSVAEVANFVHRMPLRGVWLGHPKGFRSGEIVVLKLSGWFPRTPKSVTETEFYNDYTQATTWDAKPQWGFVEALATFGYGGMSLIAGFRYRSFQRSLHQRCRITSVPR